MLPLNGGMAALILGGLALLGGQAAPLPFDVSYPQAAAPGEDVRIAIGGDDAEDVLCWNGLDIPLAGKRTVEVIVPSDAAPGTDMALSLQTKDGEKHPLPALAVVPLSSRFGRDSLVTRQAPLPGSSSTPLPTVLPVRAGGDYCVNGFRTVKRGPYISGPWPFDGPFFFRRVEPGAYSDPVWLRPIVSSKDTIADFGFDAERGRLFDRWERRLPIDAAGLIATRDGLGFLAGPAGREIGFAVTDLPSGPLTLSCWIFPEGKRGPQIIRASSMLSLSLDTAGRYSAGRADDSRQPRAATAPTPAEIGHWQHVAAVFDGMAIRLYQDGRPVAETPCSGRKSSSRPDYETLGAGKGGRNPFTGRIGGYAVYNRALSPDEIAALAEAFRSAAPPSP